MGKYPCIVVPRGLVKVLRDLPISPRDDLFLGSIIMECPSIAEQLRAVGIEVPHRKAQEMVTCPFHKERHPSFSVAHDKQLYHDFHTGEGGNRWQLAERLEEAGYDLSKMFPGYGGITGGQVRQPKPPDNEFLAACLEKMGLEEKADLASECTTHWTIGQCASCGALVSRPITCQLVFCDRCRRNRLKAFTSKHHSRLASWGGCKVLRFTTILRQQSPGWEEEAEEKREKLVSSLPSLWKQFKRKGWLEGWFYHTRLCLSEDSWIVAFYLFVPLPQFEDQWFFYLSERLAQKGFFYRDEDDYSPPFGAQEALEDIAGAPFTYYNRQQFAALYSLMKGKKLIQVAGGAYAARPQVKAKPRQAHKGKAKAKGGWRCPLCGGQVHPLGEVSWEVIIWDEEDEFWTCDPLVAEAFELAPPEQNEVEHTEPEQDEVKYQPPEFEAKDYWNDAAAKALAYLLE